MAYTITTPDKSTLLIEECDANSLTIEISDTGGDHFDSAKAGIIISKRQVAELIASLSSYLAGDAP